MTITVKTIACDNSPHRPIKQILVGAWTQFLSIMLLSLLFSAFNFFNTSGFASDFQTTSVKTSNSLEERLSTLNEEELEDFFDFVAGNALFTLYHEAGHMLISELGLPVLAQEEDAVDNLATLTMLAANSDDMDRYLTQAMVGWFLFASENYDDLIFYGEHDLNEQRGYQILCLMVGADRDTFEDLATDLDLPSDRIDSCQFDYEQASSSWETVTDPHIRDTQAPAGKVLVKHEAASPKFALLASFLKESDLVEFVAVELDTLYQLPNGVTFTSAACGEENAFWDPHTREVTMCHELLYGFAWAYFDLIED